MLRAAVIGLGDISQIHIAALQAMPQVELVAVCDNNPECAEKVQGVPFYESARELLDIAKPDVVHICLPHYLHYPMAKLAAEHGVNVFCEKPLALNYAEGVSFVNLTQKYQELRFGICLQNRYNKSVREMLDIINAGTNGAVLSVKAIVAWSRSAQYYKAAPWRGKMQEAGGGAMINQSIHTLDLMQLFAGEINTISGQTSQLAGYDIEVEDTATAVINFKNGANGMFFATIANAKNTNVEIEITLENATYFIRDNSLLKQTDDGYSLICEDERLAGTKFYYGASHQKAIAKFYQSIIDKTDDYMHAAQGVISLKMIDAICESSRTGELIKL